MRLAPLLALGLIALAPGPVFAQDAAPPQTDLIVDSIRLEAVKIDQVLKIRALPPGIQVALAFRLDNSIIVRGTPGAVSDMRSAVKVIDVAVEGGRRLSLTLKRGQPDAVRAAALALPKAGTVQIQEKTLRFEGEMEWLEAARVVVFQVELMISPPLPRKPDEPSVLSGQSRQPFTLRIPVQNGPLAPPPVRVELTVPPGLDTTVEVEGAGTARHPANDDVFEFFADSRGSLALTLSSGVRLRTRRMQVRIQYGGLRAPTRILLTPVGEQPEAVEVTVPPQRRSYVLCADRITTEGAHPGSFPAGESVAEGSVMVNWKDLVEVRARDARVRQIAAGPEADLRIVVEPLTSPRPPEGAGEAEGQPAGARPGIADLAYPARVAVSVVGDRVEYDFTRREMRAQGNVTLLWSNGFQLHVPRTRVILLLGDPNVANAESRLKLEPLPGAGAGR